MIKIERTKERTRVYTVNDEPTLTQQQFKDSCDINLILDRYMKTGELPINHKVGRYLDLSELPDYQGALDTVMRAEAAFMDLPAKLRERFQNDPSQLLNFLNNPQNNDEAIQLGLIEPKTNPNQTNDPNPNQTNDPNPTLSNPS